MTPASIAWVFLGTCVFLYWSVSHRLVLTSDEGIYLEGARRILEGQVPYRDFFVLTGPGSLWLHAAALKLFGMTLAAARTILLVDLSILASCVYWLVARHAGRALGIAAAAACIVLETAMPETAVPNHRWESAAFATLAVTILTAESGKFGALLAGMCAAAAAWVTPSVGLVGLALGACLFWSGRERLWSYLAGCAAATALAAAILATQGALVPLIEHMLWAAEHHGGSNYTVYGSRMAGYASIFEKFQGPQVILGAMLALGLAMPAVAPFIAIPLTWKLRSTLGVPLVGAISLLVTAYPRLDVGHLVFAAPLFYALAAAGIYCLPSPKLRTAALVMAGSLPAIFLASILLARMGETEYVSRVGTIRAPRQHIALVQSWEREIPPGSDLFVFPYMPIAYFVTQARNPTRYSFLQPGMMTEQDEVNVIAQLEAKPHTRVLYQDLPESAVLRIWPSTDPRRLRLRHIEEYFAQQFRTAGTIPYGKEELRLLEPLPRTTARSGELAP